MAKLSKIYIHQTAYRVLHDVLTVIRPDGSPMVRSSQVADCDRGGWSWRLYHDDNVERIVVPACLIALAAPTGYDPDHEETLDSLDVLTLEKAPGEPGWWNIIERTRHGLPRG